MLFVSAYNGPIIVIVAELIKYFVISVLLSHVVNVSEHNLYPHPSSLGCSIFCQV